MYHALVVEDSQDVAEQVRERLESIGHTCDSAETQDEARKLLAQHAYTYILLDLEIPVRYGRMARIDYGKNLLREIRQTRGYEDVPIIVITAHGHESYRLPSEVLRLGGADDFVAKPFLDGDQKLEKSIADVLRSSGRSRPGAKSHSRLAPAAEPPMSFERGELTFYPSRVELCGAKVCGDQSSGVIRHILEVLRTADAQGRRRAYSGEELSAMIATDGGPTAIAGAIRNFRNRVKRTMLVEANLEINPCSDLIVNDRQHGYRLSDKIDVVERASLLVGGQKETLAEEVPKQWEDPLSSGETRLSEADEDAHAGWILAELRKAGRIRKQQIIQRTGWSDSTVRRALARLRDDGQIVFEGSARSGYWRLA